MRVFVKRVSLPLVCCRWKNLDKNLGEDERRLEDSDKEDEEEDEETIKWRLQRIEREQFLKEQEQKVKIFSYLI